MARLKTKEELCGPQCARGYSRAYFTLVEAEVFGKGSPLNSAKATDPFLAGATGRE